MRKLPAFTLVEILVVVAILGIISLAAATPLIQSGNNQKLRANAEILADNFRRAHVFSRELKNHKVWGIVNLSPSEYALVSASAVSEIVADVRTPIPPSTYTIEQNIPLDNGIVFSSGFTQIWFIQGSGETYAQYNIDLINQNQVRMRLTVLQSGVIEIFAG